MKPGFPLFQLRSSSRCSLNTEQFRMSRPSPRPRQGPARSSPAVALAAAPSSPMASVFAPVSWPRLASTPTPAWRLPSTRPSRASTRPPAGLGRPCRRCLPFATCASLRGSDLYGDLSIDAQIPGIATDLLLLLALRAEQVGVAPVALGDADLLAAHFDVAQLLAVVQLGPPPSGGSGRRTGRSTPPPGASRTARWPGCPSSSRSWALRCSRGRPFGPREAIGMQQVRRGRIAIPCDFSGIGDLRFLLQPEGEQGLARPSPRRGPMLEAGASAPAPAGVFVKARLPSAPNRLILAAGRSRSTSPSAAASRSECWRSHAASRQLVCHLLLQRVDRALQAALGVLRHLPGRLSPAFQRGRQLLARQLRPGNDALDASNSGRAVLLLRLSAEATPVDGGLEDPQGREQRLGQVRVISDEVHQTIQRVALVVAVTFGEVATRPLADADVPEQLPVPTRSDLLYMTASAWRVPLKRATGSAGAQRRRPFGGRT